MKAELTVLVTASGAPGTAALLRGLRENGEREVRLVGTDMSERSVGRHLCDAFHLVPPGSDPGFADAIRAIVEREERRRVLPQSSFDLQGSPRTATPSRSRCSSSRPDTIRRSNDKAETYALLHRLGLPAPAFRRVNGGEAGGGRRARARLPGAPGLLQAGLLLGLARLPRPRPDASTARTSCCTNGPARSRCASRRRSSCSRPRAGRTCS